jgi:hypothetical protein
MKNATFTFLRRVMAFSPSAALILIILIAVATTTAAQTNVFVPGNASGFFGNPADIQVSLVAALTVSGPGTITVTYVSGTVTDFGDVNTGPNGVPWWSPGQQSPLEEGRGGEVTNISNLDALIGVFVPQYRAQHKGFKALDGTKNVTPVGIMPQGLFFIGMGKTFSVNEAGTLYLGINDWGVNDNGGGFNVTVTGP